MGFLGNVNTALRRTTGFEVKRAAGATAPAPSGKSAAKPMPQGAPKTRSTSGPKSGPKSGPEAVPFREPADPGVDRLLQRPVFVMSPVRSGSTLLRVLLDGHSQLHAPHELHIRRLTVGHSTRLAEQSMAALDLERGDLEHLLWDRVMHRELVRAKKPYIVEKTPSNAFAWQRISACWPDARYVFLLRHPVSIAQSWYEAHPAKRDREEAAADALRYMKAVEGARKGLTGLTVRYEDLTADPEAELRRVCEHLGLEFEPGMLNWEHKSEDSFQKGLGDWTDKIRSGSVQQARPLPGPDDVPDVLREICTAWGYGI